MLPTVNVTVRLTDQGGKPISSTEVTALLNTQEKHNGFIVPKTTRGRTNSLGEVVLSLFPNELGVSGSFYQFEYKVNEKVIKVKAVIPNSDCFLSDVASLPTFPPLSTGEIITAEIIKAKDEAIEAANRAEAAAGGDIPVATVDVAGKVKPDGITLSVDEHGTLSVTASGLKGEDGKSTYQIWLDQGNIGTEENFLESLKGMNGSDGIINGLNEINIVEGEGISLDLTDSTLTISLKPTEPISVLSETTLEESSPEEAQPLMIALGTGYTLLDHSIKESGSGLFLYMKIVKSNGSNFPAMRLSIPLVLSGNKAILQDYHIGVCELMKEDGIVGIGTYRIGKDSKLHVFIPVTCPEICLQLFIPS